MDPITISLVVKKVLPTALKLISHLCTGAAPYILSRELANKIEPQLSKIQSAIKDLKIKNLNVAKRLFENALLELGQKFEEYASTSADLLKDHSEIIKEKLTKAQDSALEANHAGLSTKDRLTTFKWILATELLGVLNEATSKSKSKLGPQDMEWIQKRLRHARQFCNKYLNEANQIVEITDFIALKITADGGKIWASNQTEAVCQLLTLNLQISAFFCFMEHTYGVASARDGAGDRDVDDDDNGDNKVDGNRNRVIDGTGTADGVGSNCAGLSAGIAIAMVTSTALGQPMALEATVLGMERLKTNDRDLEPEVVASKLIEAGRGKAEVQEPLLNEMSPMEIASRLFEKTGEESYGDIVHQFQILKEINDPFRQFLQSNNAEILTSIFTRLSNMKPEMRHQAVSIMEEQYPNKVFIQAMVGNQVLEPFRVYKEAENTVVRQLSTMWPEMRSETLSIMREKCPDDEFLHMIVANQVLQPFRDYLDTKSTDTLLKVFSALWPEIRAQSVSMMREKYPAGEFLEALVVCLNMDTLFPTEPEALVGCMNMDTSFPSDPEAVSVSEEAKCRWIEEAGFRDVASLTHGGSASASSQISGHKPEGAFVSGRKGAEEWRSYGNPNKMEEFLEREMTSASTPAVFALHNGGWKTYGPRKFKVLARGDEGTEWETVLEADGVEWEKEQWKFWVIRKKMSVKAFRIVVQEVEKTYVIIKNVKLYC